MTATPTHAPSSASTRTGRLVRQALAAGCLLCALSPASALPPDVEADRLLLQASNEMAKENGVQPTVVLQALEAAEATGVRMPENFNFHLGRALMQVGEAEAAIPRLDRYLTAQGKNAKYYKEALEALTNAQAVAAERKRRGAWERFEWHDKAAGELRDRKTGLIWQYCNSFYGIWNGRACAGDTVAYPWQQALDLAQAEARRSGKAWRLPTRAELLEVAAQFPATGIQTWTSDVASGDKAYQVTELNAKRRALGEPRTDGELSYEFSKSTKLSYRLVR